MIKIHRGIRWVWRLIKDWYGLLLIAAFLIGLAWIFVWVFQNPVSNSSACHAAQAAAIGVAQRDPQDAQEVTRLTLGPCS